MDRKTVADHPMSKDNVLTRAKKRHALACVQANRVGEALALYQKICEVDPRDVESWFMMGTLYGRVGRLSEAEAALRKAVDVEPNFAQGHLTLGQALELQGKLDEAGDSYRRALGLKADLADAHDALGRLGQLRGDLRGAIAHHQRALQLNPQRVASHLSLARALQQLGNLDEAAAAIEQALKLDSNQAEAYYDLAGVRMGQGRYDEGLAAIRQSLQLKPDYVAAKAVEAYILEHLRDYQGAVDCLTPLLDRYQEHPEVALVYARLCHFTGDYEGAITRLESLLGRDDLATERRAQVHFRLGELYDRRGEFARAFTHYQAGNQLKPVQFDAREWEDRITRLIQTFNREAMQRAPRAGNCSERPIFIVGMPRSGTTLVEQIMSMYPEAATAGELPDIGRLAAEFQAMLARTVPNDDITQLSREQCDALAQPYLTMLERRFPHSKRVTDKLPQNFLHLGIIALLFPMARVIHCVRDPVDTCLSCYFQEFSGDLPYAYDLANLGEYYRQYQRLMEHWTAILDIPVFELRYEDLVREPSKVGQAMVEFCGLKWDEECLEFHKSKRLVATASFQQVRQPIHAGSVGRWQQYADYLEPLKRALAGQRPS